MSLRLSLALWYGALTGLVLLVVSLMTYATHSRGHYEDLDRVLKGTVAHAAEESMLNSSPDGLTAMLAVPVEPDLAVRVHGADGTVLAASPNAAAAPLLDPRQVLARPSPPPFDPVVGLAPPLFRVDPGRGAFGTTTDDAGRRWRLYALPVVEVGEYVFAAVPLDRVDMAIARFRYLVPFFTVIGAGLTFLGGRLLAGRALRPVATLTSIAAAIARSRNFGRRVPVRETARDELGRLAATFNEMLVSLEQAYRAQQRFVADASHELRAPLTAIQANLELLERRPDMSGEDRQEAVTEASREARRLAQLVADLLALARADAGVALRQQQVELDGLVMEQLGAARQLVQSQRLVVDALEPVVVAGDPDRLKQLVLILIDNALKYTPAGGSVSVALRSADGTATLAGRDTGLGIAPEELPHVFQRFYRADPARARDPGGSGLGLAIAKWIVEQHGGAVSLASEPGKGTTASVTLPVAHTSGQ
ncbi:MAG: sensor histidine kinase [Chloroflexota bacterium]